MLSFGQRCKLLRREAGLSQAFVAEQIGVSVQSVSNWECDNTMPDISQIVPLAAILNVSTDCLLGVGTNEEADREQLDEQVRTIWANESVNVPENNADYMVYELCRDFLKKYPLNYEIKYRCALAMNDYLVVSAFRHKFTIPEKEFERLYTECERMLCSICDHDMNSQRQIQARELLVQHLLLKEKWAEAESVAAELPVLCGLRDNMLRSIAQSRKNNEDALKAAEMTCKIKSREYLLSLFYLARCLSDHEGAHKKDVFAAWMEMVKASQDNIRLFLDASDLAVNSYEKNPYCYLITAFASQCSDYLLISDFENALSCVEKATDAAIALYTWAKEVCTDELVMADVVFFVKQTPKWCCRSLSDFDHSFTREDRYKICVERINELL